LLDQAISVSDAFLEKGEIVSTRGRNAEETQRFNARAGDLTKNKPLIVLINGGSARSEEHTSELQSLTNLVCRLLLEKKNNNTTNVSPVRTSPPINTPPCPWRGWPHSAPPHKDRAAGAAGVMAKLTRQHASAASPDRRGRPDGRG